MTTNLLDFDSAGLTAWFGARGEKPFRARQVMKWMHKEQVADFGAMTDLAKSLRAKLDAEASIALPPIVGDSIAADGTRKWLLDVGNGNAVESVFIPEDDRGTLCISTQAGCAVDATSVRTSAAIVTSGATTLCMAPFDTIVSWMTR